jgi:hypothetical protein
MLKSSTATTSKGNDDEAAAWNAADHAAARQLTGSVDSPPGNKRAVALVIATSG